MLAFLAKSLEGGFIYEEVKVQRGADRLCLAHAGDGHTGGRSLPEARDHRADVLPLEASVRRAQMPENYIFDWIIFWVGLIQCIDL